MGFYDVYDVNQRTLEPVSLLTGSRARSVRSVSHNTRAPAMGPQQAAFRRVGCSAL